MSVFELDISWAATAPQRRSLQWELITCDQVPAQDAGEVTTDGLLASYAEKPLTLRIGGKATVGPVVLGSGELRELRGHVETAVYSTGNREVTLRHDEFEGALRLVDAMIAARQAV